MLNENSDWPWLGHIPAAPPPPPAWGRAEPWLEQGRGNFTKGKLLSKEEKRNAGQAKIMRIPTLPNNHLHLDQRQECKDWVYVFLGPRFYCKWQFHGPPPPIPLPNVHILPSLPTLIQMPPRLQDLTSFHQIKSNHPTHSHQALQCSSIHLLSHVWLFAIPWTAARQTSLSITNSQSLLTFMSIKSVMPSNIRIFSKESVLCIRWPKY